MIEVQADPTPPAGGRKKLFIWGVLGTMFTLLIVGIAPRLRSAHRAQEGGENEHISVTVTSVSRAAPNGEVLLPAEARAMLETAIFAHTEGYVRRRYAEIGQYVQQGQLLLEIDSPEITGQLGNARARMDKVRADRDLAKTTSERWSRLLQVHAVSQQDADQKAADYEARQAELAGAQADLQRLTDMYAYLRITAPFAGIIVDRDLDLEVGNLITAGSGRTSRALFRIANRENLKVFAHVPQLYSRSVHEGDDVALIAQELPGRTFRGKVVHLAGALDPESRTMLMEIQVPNPDHALLPGMFIQARTQVRATDRPLVIPSNALIFNANGMNVARVLPQGKIQYRRVEVGRDFGESVEVLFGLAENDKIVTNPPANIEDGMTVLVIADAADTAKKQDDQKTKK